MLKKIATLATLWVLMASSAVGTEVKTKFYKAIITGDGEIKVFYDIRNGKRFSQGPFWNINFKPADCMYFFGKMKDADGKFPEKYKFKSKTKDGIAIEGEAVFTEDSIKVFSMHKDNGKKSAPKIMCECADYSFVYVMEGLNFIAQSSTQAYKGTFQKYIPKPFTFDKWIEIFPLGSTRCKISTQDGTEFLVKDAKTRTNSIKRSLKWASLTASAKNKAKTAFELNFRPFNSPPSKVTGKIVSAVVEKDRFDALPEPETVFVNGIRILPLKRRSPVYTVGEKVELAIEKQAGTAPWKELEIKLKDVYSGSSSKFRLKTETKNRRVFTMDSAKPSVYLIEVLNARKKAMFEYEIAVAGPIPQCMVTWDKMESALNKKLVEEIDLTSNSGEHPKYSHNGPAIVTEKPFGKYWESAPSSAISDTTWLSVRFTLKNPKKIHLIEIDYPDDDNRLIGFTIGSVNKSPRSGDTKLFNTCANGGVHCGSPSPLSNTMKTWQTIYFPPDYWGTIQATSLKVGQTAAISKIRIYELPNGLPGLKIFGPRTDEPRLFGQYWERHNLAFRFCSDMQGVKIDWGFLPSDKDYYKGFYRIARNLIQYLRYKGENTLCVNMYMYKNYWGMQNFGFTYNDEEKDPVELMARMFNQNGMKLILSCENLTTDILSGAFNTSDEEAIEGKKTNSSISMKGIQNAKELGNPYRTHHIRPDTEVYRTETKRIYKNIAEYYKNTPGIVGIINAMYTPSYESLYAFPMHWWKKYLKGNVLLEFSYDDETIANFEKYLGREIPVKSKGKARFRKRYDWIMANARGKWIEFRAAIFRQVNDEIAREIKKINPKWKYMVRDSWSPPQAHRVIQCGMTTYHDLRRQSGYAPEFYKEDQDVELINTIPSLDSWTEAVYDVFKAKIIKNNKNIDFYKKSDNGKDSSYFLMNVFKEVSKPNIKKIPWFFQYFNLVEYTEPVGRYIFKDLIAAMAYGNPSLFLKVWCDCQMMTGNENHYQKIMAAYRAMPRGSYEFLSPAKDQEATLRALKLDGKNLFYMANPSFFEKTMKIKAETITDLTTGKTISAKNGTITVALSPCDLRAFSSREMPGFVEIKTETDKFFEKNLAMVKDKIKVAEKSGISTARAKADVKNIKKLVLDKKFDSAADLLINSLEIKKIYTQLVNNGKGKGWTWCYLGPFPLSTQKGYFVTSGVNKFETEFIKEDMPPDFERTYSNFNDEPVKWEKFVTKPGKINFGNIYPWEADYTVSYACIGIESSKGQKATILSGSSDNIKIWLNGKKVHNMKRGSRDARLGQDKIDVTLKKGYNLIMFKVHNYINLYQIMLKVVPQERGTVKIVPPKGRK